MNDAELLALFRLAESDRVERKESNANPDRIRQAICAHANDLPNHRETGVIFVGQRDDLTCAGLNVDDRLLQTLAGYRSEGLILPFPTMTVRRMLLDGCRVAVIEVEPSDNPPEDVPDYPEEAFRQLIRNAVLHRAYEGTNAPVRITWFSDRVEIQNPGGPYGQVTRQTFGQPGVADYRNPTLAEAMKSLGFIERFGVGIAIARDRLATNGNPPPDFTVEDAHVLVTVRPRP